MESKITITKKKYEKQDYIELIANAVDRVLNGKCLIIFFGSILTDRFNRTSDIDVAVYCKEKLSSRVYIKILDEIDRLPILREVDIVDVVQIRDTELVKNIIQRGKIWKNIPELSKDLKKHLESLER